MASFMKKYEGETYALLRIMAGAMFIFFGTQKLFAFPGPMTQNAPDFVIYGAGSIELVGGLLIAIGLFTSWAAFISAGQMAAAYWMAHGLTNFWPVLNEGTLAALYCFVFLFVSARGAGKWSVDGLRGSS
jgi:putative oxidoreductase